MRGNVALGRLPEGDGDGEGIVAEINITPLTDIFLGAADHLHDHQLGADGGVRRVRWTCPRPASRRA